jgi:hypothetical protein
MGLNSERVNIHPSPDKVFRAKLLTFSQKPVQDVAKFFGVGGGTTDLADFSQCFFGLNPGVLVLEFELYRDGAESVISRVLWVFFVAKLLGFCT